MTNEEIKTHINERIEALKLELESAFTRVTKKTEFEEGVWYKNSDGHCHGLFSKKGNFNKGFINENWHDTLYMGDVSFWQKVTDFTELEELLKKEAVKKGMVDGAYKLFEDGTKQKIQHPLHFINENKCLFDDDGLILMDAKGNWAEVVKEKTTEEWIKDFKENSKAYNLYEFFEENNLEITQKK